MGRRRGSLLVWSLSLLVLSLKKDLGCGGGRAVLGHGAGPLTKGGCRDGRLRILGRRAAFGARRSRMGWWWGSASGGVRAFRRAELGPGFMPRRHRASHGGFASHNRSGKSLGPAAALPWACEVECSSLKISRLRCSAPIYPLPAGAASGPPVASGAPKTLKGNMLFTLCTACAAPCPKTPCAARHAPPATARSAAALRRSRAGREICGASQAAAAPSNTSRQKVRGGRRGRGRGVRGGHGGSGVLLFGGRRSRKAVARCRAAGVRFRARVLLGAAGPGFVAEAEESWTHASMQVAAVARPLCEQDYHGVVRSPRVGVLEDVRGAAGGGRGRASAMTRSGRFILRPVPRMRCP